MAITRTQQHHARTGSSRTHTGSSFIKDIIGTMTDFYRKAAEKARDPEVITMFLSLAEDEQKQIGTLRAFRGRSSARIRSAGSAKKMISDLKKKESRLLSTIGARTNEVEAMKIAMDLEEEGIRLYGKLLREANSPVQKEIINRLLSEGRQRHTTFENTCSFLTDPAGWHMWNEQGVMDGGTSWA